MVKFTIDGKWNGVFDGLGQGGAEKEEEREEVLYHRTVGSLETRENQKPKADDSKDSSNNNESSKIVFTPK